MSVNIDYLLIKCYNITMDIETNETSLSRLESIVGTHAHHIESTQSEADLDQLIAELSAAGYDEQEMQEYLEDNPQFAKYYDFIEAIDDVFSDDTSTRTILRHQKLNQVSDYGQKTVEQFVSKMGRNPTLNEVFKFTAIHLTRVADATRESSIPVNATFESHVVNTTTNKLLTYCDFSTLCPISYSQDYSVHSQTAEQFNQQRSALGMPAINHDFIANKFLYVSQSAGNLGNFIRGAIATPDFYETAEAVEMAKEHNDVFAKNMQKVRRFGINPVVFDAGSLLPNTELVYSSPKSIADNVAFSENALGAVRFVNSDTDPELMFVKKTIPGTAAIAYEGTLSYSSFDSTGNLFLGIEGNTGLSVKTIFERIGKPNTYEVLRGMLLAKLFDAIAPPSVITTHNDKASAHPKQLTESTKSPNDVVTTMVLPRIHYLSKRQRDIKKDFEAANTEDKLVATNLRSHSVAEHLRRIPENARPSKEAILMSKSVFGDAYELPEGYTFVRAHERGNEANGRVLGHIAVSKSVSI